MSGNQEGVYQNKQFPHPIPISPYFYANPLKTKFTDMAFSKAHLFDPSDQITSVFAKALSHPVRLDILRTLSSKGPCTVEYLSFQYPISKSTLSQHLELLRKVGLIKFRINHPHIIYFLDTQTFSQCQTRLQEFCKKIYN